MGNSVDGFAIRLVGHYFFYEIDVGGTFYGDDLLELVDAKRPQPK